MVLRLIYIAFLLFLAACGELSFENPTDPRNVSHPGNIAYTSFTDERDGKSYKSVVINGQTWMAENLNYDSPDSRCVDYVKRNHTFQDTLVSDGGYCDVYGRLYNWETAMSVCPSGWHLPGKAEWEKLLSFASWENLKSKQGWGKDSLGKDTYGFTAIPNNYNNSWWSIIDGSGYQYNQYSGCTYNCVYSSVRCLKDELCGSKPFNGGTQICDNGVIYGLCGNKTYDLESQRCNNNVIETKCGNNAWYDATDASLKCENNIVKTQCGDEWQGPYDPKTEYCDGSSIKSYGSFTDTRNGKIYRTVEIDTQVWMTENLNYDTTGSYCYSYSEANCGKYGRLYSWATAMALPASCNSSLCPSQINPKHKGICPDGWHVPSAADWEALMRYVDGNTGNVNDYDGRYGSPSAGKYLRATNEWKECVDSQYFLNRCEDTYGFAALPGGDRSDSFFGIGTSGLWWTSSEAGVYNKTSYLAYRFILHNFSEDAKLFEANKFILNSVRCIKN